MQVHVHPVALWPVTAEKAPWKPVIECVLQLQALWLHCHYDEMITALVEAMRHGNESKNGLTFYHHFTEEAMTVTGSVHCEVTLACLVKHPTAAIPVHGMEVQCDVWFFPFVTCSNLTRLHRQSALVGSEISPS
jgi:hypothetical protein